MSSVWIQKTIHLRSRRRGFHVITREIEKELPELRTLGMGVAHFFIQHTSASLTINENVSGDVRDDMEAHLNVMVPENSPHFTHRSEGSDDMPAHIKSSLLGHSLTIPVTNGRLQLGTWQGIYLCEHRNHGGSRRLVVTLQGETRRQDK